jgi:hypothetical protein
MRVECAKQFTLLSAELARAANGRVEQATQIANLTKTISEYHTENLRATGELKDALGRHLVVMENRLTNLESSSKSAHHRLDFLQTKFWWFIGIFATTAIGLVIAAIEGIF